MTTPLCHSEPAEESLLDFSTSVEMTKGVFSMTEYACHSEPVEESLDTSVARQVGSFQYDKVCGWFVARVLRG